MEEEQVDECTKKDQQRWKNGKEAVNIMRSVDRGEEVKEGRQTT